MCNVDHSVAAQFHSYMGKGEYRISFLNVTNPDVFRKELDICKEERVDSTYGDDYFLWWYNSKEEIVASWMPAEKRVHVFYNSR